MQATFKLNIEQLNNEFIKKIKNIYKNKAKVEIYVNDELDETDYLLSTENNRESLQKSLDELKSAQTVIKSEDFFN